MARGGFPRRRTPVRSFESMDDWAFAPGDRFDRTINFHVVMNPDGPSAYISERAISGAMLTTPDSDRWVVVATIAGHPIGWAMCSRSPHDLTLAVLEEVVATEPFQRKGLGSDLVTRALAIARDLGVDTVSADPVGDDWDRAVFYHRLGFLSASDGLMSVTLLSA